VTTPAPEGFTSRLLRGVAQWIAGTGLAVWQPVEPYVAGTTGVFLRKVPQTPDRAVVLTAYMVGATEPHLSDVVLGLNVRVRGAAGDADGADDLADALADLLDGAELLDFAGITAALVWRQSTTSLGPDPTSGQDEARRAERSDNYRVRAARLTDHRTD